MKLLVTGSLGFIGNNLFLDLKFPGFEETYSASRISVIANINYEFFKKF